MVTRMIAFMSPLTRCYEIMACPYVLHPLKCGHTFDAICILRWFFSKAHQACGGWHEYVACPICRSQLIVTPERTPRHEITFPFVPNRTVDAAVQDLISKLEIPGSGLKKEGLAVKGRVKVKKEDGDGPSTALDGWKAGGSSRKDWVKRDRQAFCWFNISKRKIIKRSFHQTRKRRNGLPHDELGKATRT